MIKFGNAVIENWINSFRGHLGIETDQPSGFSTLEVNIPHGLIENLDSPIVVLSSKSRFGAARYALFRVKVVISKERSGDGVYLLVQDSKWNVVDSKVTFNPY